ncbi:FGE-sulfatase domain-containing protein [Rubrivivax sp. A210]|uniref:SUMF1/EgtB/PvdO family nonheme iron enzyme n=1 Tax=Rubrivivax sp. A210 TaxID=2772301 RepID=UPI00191A26EC|nr:SUMF1/EgtB/PvdO family nonheme iron enzyme [Rubrivivax sp. A210]CAD5372499.1 FGE-sulfatase domain-containing protein [Rubrivivax sp. A210]
MGSWGSSGGIGDSVVGGRSRALDDPLAIRTAGRELLSLALIDARNRLLALLAEDESAPALRLAARAGWFQEYWIACHVQRQRGEACDPAATRLAGIELAIDAWRAPEGPPPAPADLRSYLAETLEITLDLLAASTEDDAALHFFRLALQHEDRVVEALVEAGRHGTPPQRPQREPIWLPAQRWALGSPRAGGLQPWGERWAHEVAVPEFEIDAQAVSWARYVEFADDGGYDRAELWSVAGWAWAQACGRRAPRHVEQLHGGVLVQRGRGVVRVHPAQAAVHVSRFEAEAWCRWAGRRLPTEPEWELAATRAGGQGFAWGDVLEWMAGGARPWPGAGAPSPGTLDLIPAADAGPIGLIGVLRGASFATPPRWRHVKARRFALPDEDGASCGFRSCAA